MDLADVLFELNNSDFLLALYNIQIKIDIVIDLADGV